VAVKVFGATERGEADLLGRLQREVDILGRVRHEALTPLWDHRLDGPTRFLVFPCYGGGDLAARIDARTLSQLEVHALGLQVAGALDALHAAGAVHRDVKAANVFLDPGGRPVLGDLGLVRGEEHVPLTTQGVAVGTLGFMAPEVRRGEPATPASDVFSLGVVLWEAAGGTRPAVTAHEVVFGPGGRPPGLTATSEALVRRMLEADPSRRPGAAEVQRRLRDAGDPGEDLATVTLALDEAARRAEAARRVHRARAEPRPDTPPQAPWRSIAAGLGLVALGLAIGVASRRVAPRPPPASQPPAPARSDVTALLAGLEAALDEEARRLGDGATGRPGQAHVLRWLAAGNDPAQVPALVRRRLEQHDERLRAAGEGAVFSSLLVQPAATPGSDRARALAARADALRH
jgi:serine/threonine-protein kinase